MLMCVCVLGCACILLCMCQCVCMCLCSIIVFLLHFKFNETDYASTMSIINAYMNFSCIDAGEHDVVTREVTLLAKLDHTSIVRYHTAWWEYSKEDRNNTVEGMSMSICCILSVIFTVTRNLLLCLVMLI